MKIAFLKFLKKMGIEGENEEIFAWKRLLKDVCQEGHINIHELMYVIKSFHVKVTENITDVFPNWKINSLQIAGGGSYGTALSFEHIDSSRRIMKFITLDQQYNLRTAISEIIICKKVSDLAEDTIFSVVNFPKVHRVTIVKSGIPQYLQHMFSDYYQNDVDPERFNPHIDLRGEKLSIAVEMEYCGVPCSPQNFRNPWAPISLISQIVSALAVAESAHGLEHRDLHIGNILLLQMDKRFITYVSKDHTWKINSLRVMVKIIDFTSARINIDGDIYFKPIDFVGPDEPLPPSLDRTFWLNHRNVYKLMGRCLNTKFEKCETATNVLWIKYLMEVMLNETEIQSPNDIAADHALLTPLNLLRHWNSHVLKYSSANSVLRNLISENNELFERINN